MRKKCNQITGIFLKFFAPRRNIFCGKEGKGKIRKKIKICRACAFKRKTGIQKRERKAAAAAERCLCGAHISALCFKRRFYGMSARRCGRRALRHERRFFTGCAALSYARGVDDGLAGRVRFGCCLPAACDDGLAAVRHARFFSEKIKKVRPLVGPYRKSVHMMI